MGMHIALLQLGLWTLYLAASLFVLVEGSGIFLKGAKQLGSAFGLSSFAIGVSIIAFGTSLPELASSIVAVLQGHTEIVIANVTGSNITNILLVVGVVAVIKGRIAIAQELIATELSIFLIATALFLLMLYDGTVDRFEALLLLGTFTAYVCYLFGSGRGKSPLPSRKKKAKPRIDLRSLAYIAIGVAGVLIGAHYTVDMTVHLASALLLPVGLITIGALAFGTSLPDLFVSLHALRDGDAELAIGNVFGSNAFNILAVIGIPALITPLTSEPIIAQIVIPVMVAASAIFFVIGLSKQVLRWEGVMLLLFFVFFIAKLATFIQS